MSDNSTIKANSAFEYCIRMGVANVSKHAAMSMAAIAVTAACLLLMACVYLVSINTTVNMENFQSENAMLAFVSDSISIDEEMELGAAIKRIKGVRDVRLVTKEEAYQTYSEQYGGKDSKYLSAAIFRDRYAIEVEHGYTLTEVSVAVKELEGVEDVRSDEAITNGFQALQRLIRLVGTVSIILMGVVSVFIVINTIKLTMSNRKEEYAVMQMMGASDKFLRIPLLSEGAITGGFAAVIAFVLSMLLYQSMKSIMSGAEILSLITILPLHEVAMPTLCIVLALGFGIGIGGSYIGIRKFLNV